MANTRSHGLDFIKILATIIIFFSHYQQVHNVIFTNHINFFNGFLYWGYLVELFFIISGYLMARYIPRITKGEISFDVWFAHRVKRILPMVSVTVIAYAALFLVYKHVMGHYFLDIPRDISLWYIVIGSLGLDTGGVFSRTLLNNPVWYLSVLIICYSVFYLACVLSAKLSCKPYYLFVFMIFVGFAINEYCFVFPFFNADTARGYTSFFTGVLLALYVKNYGITKAECILSFAMLAIYCGLLAVRPGYVLFKADYVLTFLVFPAFIFLAESAAAKKLFRHRLWEKWSAVSFNVYVWHTPFFMAAEMFLRLTGPAGPEAFPEIRGREWKKCEQRPALYTCWKPYGSQTVFRSIGKNLSARKALRQNT